MNDLTQAIKQHLTEIFEQSRAQYRSMFVSEVQCRHTIFYDIELIDYDDDTRKNGYRNIGSNYATLSYRLSCTIPGLHIQTRIDFLRQNEIIYETHYIKIKNSHNKETSTSSPKIKISILQPDFLDRITTIAQEHIKIINNPKLMDTKMKRANMFVW
jgi:hypothetical protein